MNGFWSRRHTSESSVSFKPAHTGCELPLHTWKKMRFEDGSHSFLLSSSLFSVSRLLVCFPSYKLPQWEDFTPAGRESTICRRPLLFLLYLPPRLSRPSTPPPSLAEWQYHLPPNRKRWTVNLGQSAVKNMTHSSTMKTWLAHTHTHTHTRTHTLACMHADTFHTNSCKSCAI